MINDLKEKKIHLFVCTSLQIYIYIYIYVLKSNMHKIFKKNLLYILMSQFPMQVKK